MKIFYITLNNAHEAELISQHLLQQRLAVCTNWFPITCAYRQGEEIKQGSEVVLIVKTLDSMREAIEAVICQHITYTNFIAELAVSSVNAAFWQWLQQEVIPPT